MSFTTRPPTTRAGTTLVVRPADLLTVIVAGGGATGLASGVVPHGAVRHLLVDRPLHHQAARPLPAPTSVDEDARDVADARRVLADPTEGRVSLDRLRRDLGF